MFCSRCGTNAAAATFCPNCGAQLTQHQSQTYLRQQSPVQNAGGAVRQSKAAVIIAGVLAGVLIVILFAVGGILLFHQNSSGATESARLAEQAQSPPVAPTSPPVASPSPAAPAQKRKPKFQASGTGAVESLPTGLFCRDMMARGYSYVAATHYWRIHGEPNQMDADRNGIPCETVYPATDVSAYWSVRELPPAAALGSGMLPTGLLCRDLYARGLSYADAVAYWWSDGAPDRMDADLNGIPCETVYPTYDINAYW